MKVCDYLFLFLFLFLGVLTVQYVPPEAIIQRCSVKKVFLKFCKIYRKTPVLESLFKKRLWHKYFPVNFAEFLRAPFL